VNSRHDRWESLVGTRAATSADRLERTGGWELRAVRAMRAPRPRGADFLTVELGTLADRVWAARWAVEQAKFEKVAAEERWPVLQLADC
jgi:hypothetical protein